MANGRVSPESTSHCYLLNMLAVGLTVSDKKIFLKYPIIKSIETLDPQGRASLDPSNLIGRIIKGTTRYCYLLNI